METDDVPLGMFGGELDSVPLAEFENRRRERNDYEKHWDEVMRLLERTGEDQPTEVDLDAMSPEELEDLIAGLDEKPGKG
jgi:hypothetical protein